MHVIPIPSPLPPSQSLPYPSLSPLSPRTRSLFGSGDYWRVNFFFVSTPLFLVSNVQLFAPSDEELQEVVTKIRSIVSANGAAITDCTLYRDHPLWLLPWLWHQWRCGFPSVVEGCGDPSAVASVVAVVVAVVFMLQMSLVWIRCRVQCPMVCTPHTSGCWYLALVLCLDL